MLSKLRFHCSRYAIIGCALTVFVAFQTSPGLAAPPASAVLLDFKDDAQLGQIHVNGHTTIERAPESYQGNRAAKITFAPVPQGVRDYPAAVLEGPALKVHDFSGFEAISLWVKNPGPEAVELSLAVFDKDGNRSFPIPSTVTIKPGRWEQAVARLVLQGLDVKQIGSVHFYQKMNRRPVTLLIADVQLLSPSAGRLAGRLQGARQALAIARGNAAALGAKDQIEPKIASLTHELDQFENSPASVSTERLAQVAVEAQDLSKSIQIANGGKKVVLTGPLVQAAWLSNPDKIKLIVEFTLTNTALGDEVFGLLAPAKDLEVLVLDSRKITGAGLGKLTSDKLRSLTLSSTGASDDALKDAGKFPKLQSIELDGTNVTSGVLQHFGALKQLKSLSLAATQVGDSGFDAIGKLVNLESLNLKRTRIHGQGVRQLAGLAKLKMLDLGDTQLDDADVSQFGKMPQLESLSLENTPITGASFGNLAGLDKLTTLNLNRTRIGDTALKQFGKLPKLKTLELSSTRVSDGGLTHILESASQLGYLDLFGTNITDASLASLQNKVALYSLFLGGTQTTDVGLSYLQKLPTLQHLDLEGTQITDAGLQYLQGRRLFDLRVGKTRLSGAGLKYLANTRGLLFLDLSGTSVSDESLTAFAKLDHLLTLNLNGTRVTSKGMALLKGCGQLKELQLEATKVGDEGIAALSPLQNLQHLNLNETSITNAGLTHLKALKKLFDLALGRTRVTDDGLKELGDKFTELDLSHDRITNQGVEQIQRCGGLFALRLASTDITNDGLKTLQTLPGLARLDLAETAVDDQGLHYLGLLPQLQDLHLDGTSVSDRGIDAIVKLSSLQRVSLEGSRISMQGASYLRHIAPKLQVALVYPFVWGERWSYFSVPEATGKEQSPARFVENLKKLPNLRYLHVDDAMLTPDVLKSMKDLPKLEHLSFQNTSVTDDMLADLLGLSQIARLDFSNTGITDGGLEHLKDMQGLRELNFDGARITGAGFASLANLSRLQAMNLSHTPLDDAGVARLAGLKELRKLELSGTHVTDAGVEALSQLPRLQYLDLNGTAVTDRGLAILSRQKGLRYCYLTNTPITDAGIEHLGALSELDELGVDGTQLTDQGLASLTSLTNLSRLRIGRTRVTEASLPRIALMPNIDRLELADLPVTDKGLQSILPLSRLRLLDLSGTRITNDALATLAKFPLLTELNVRDTALSPDAIARFQKTHPGLSITTGITPRMVPPGYSVWAKVIAIFYIIAVGAICLYGGHRYWLTWRLLTDRRSRKSPEPAGQFAELPRVTVQLPMFNERHVAQRIIEAACALDYPRERLQIQVLDDSNDDSADIARKCSERMAALGHPVEYLHRSGREGFKSGALAAGLKIASGEFIVVFDADFLPAPDFLRQTIQYFTDPKVGVVQAEWSHLNRADSWLTALQAMFLDGHFVVEQTVRSHCQRWFNFNGTAGVWRRSCIDEAGGWQHDTLTEDTDLSYRAQLKGWKFLYLPTVHCNAELPSTMSAFLGQQHRWTKGLIQTARKLLPRILFSRVPLKIKIEAWFHLTTPVMYLFMFLVTAIALPAMFLVTPFTDRPRLGLAVGLSTLLLGTFGAATFYVASQRVQGLSLWKAICKIPFLMALGVGISAVNARAVVEALLGFRSPFVRTPKFGARGDYDPDQLSRRRRVRFPAGLIELLIAGVLYACFVLCFLRPFTLIGAPFLLLFALGYTGVGVLRLMDLYATHATHVRSAAVPWQRLSFARFATGAMGAMILAGVALATLRVTSSAQARQLQAAQISANQRKIEPVSLGLDLTTANWQAIESAGAVKAVHVERGSLVLDVELDEKTHEGAIHFDLDGAMKALGDSLGQQRQLAFNVEYPPRFTGEFQAFVKDRKNRDGNSEYGNMHIVESHDIPRPVNISLIPDVHCPAMGYQDKGFDPAPGIHQIGFKISAQSDRVTGAGYRPFRGTIRIAGVRVTDIDRAAHPEPEIRPPAKQGQALAALPAAQFLAGSGVDRPWPINYAFSGPLTPAHIQELEKTYTAIAAQGCRFTRVYIGDYRTGIQFDSSGNATGADSEFLDYLDELAAIANRHGITVMFSLTDNAMLNGGRAESIALVRDGAPSDAFVNHVLASFVKKLAGRQVIWDVFNEPENVTTLPLREVQSYVDRVLAAGRSADPHARFTVVSRSRPEIVYWQARGLDLYSHNVFTARSLEESLTEKPRLLDAPIMVAEMAPELASTKNLNALRNAGYAGIGIWGWGTHDKYEWQAADLERIVQPLLAPVAHAEVP